MRRALLFILLFSCSGEVSGGSGGGSGGGTSGATGGGSSGGANGGGTGGSGGGDVVVDAGSDAGFDAGTVDAGSDAGIPDAGVDAGCRARFCEDFERYDAGRAPSAPWTTSVQGGTTLIDTTRKHGGAKAVRVTNAGAVAYERAYFSIASPSFFPAPGNQFYGRAWFYVTAVPPMTTHWTNISGEGRAPDAGTNVTAYVRYGGQVMKHLMANYDTSNVGSDCWQHSTVAMPEGTWNCYEWHFDQPNNRMELWLDGTQISALTVNGTGMGCITNGLGGKWILPQFDTLRLGWEHYQTSIPIEMWVDDVALDSQRIGCGP